MGAIFGIYNLNGEPVDAGHLQKMQARLQHYGRDAQESVIEQNIGLGGCINDWSSQSPQEVPLISDDGYIIVGDTQVYNRPELLSQLNLPPETSNPAIIRAAYKKWGQDCPKHINGDFTFAIWDKQQQKLFIARDHLGVRPLFYALQNGTLVFATDIRAVLTLPFVSRQFDEIIMYATLTNTYHLDPEATYFEKVKRLPAAHNLIMDAHGPHKKKYWTPGENKTTLDTEEEYAQALYNVVSDAVKIRVADRPKMGTELSGGLDSSVVTIVANRELCKEGKPLEAFSWSPPYEVVEKQPDDERVLVEAVCRQEGLEITYYDPEKPGTKTFLELNRNIALTWDEFYQEYEHFTSQGVKLILSGHGGDEGASYRYSMYGMFLNGYWKEFWQEAKFRAQGSPLKMIKIVIGNTIYSVLTPYNFLGRYNFIQTPYRGVPHIADAQFRKRLKPFCKEDVLYYRFDLVKHIQSGGIQIRTELTALNGAYYDVQHTFPLLDHRVINLAMSIPRVMLLKQGLNRNIYRKAFAPILPAEVCGFLLKDDTAISAFYRISRNPGKWQRLVSAMKCLRRGQFEDYLDWEKLAQVISNPAADNDLQLAMEERLWPMYEIQRLLEGLDCEPQ